MKHSLLNQKLINPVGVKYVYSDLSMITMQFVIGTLAQNLGYVSNADLLPGCEGGGEGKSAALLLSVCAVCWLLARAVPTL